MLRRLIGEDIHLLWAPGAHVGPVNMDPSQIDQILANLAVNARDAIGGVGRVTIETSGMRCDTGDGATVHPEARPGQDYVTLGVSGDLSNVTWNSTDDGSSNGGAQVQLLGAPLAGPAGVVVEQVELRIERNGSVLRNGNVLRNGSVLSLYYRTDESAEWTELDASPLNREDLDTLELEVGIYQTSEAQATAVIDDFSIQSEKHHVSGFE
jgi:hypothetical protein